MEKKKKKSQRRERVGGLNERTQSKARRQQLERQLRPFLSSHRPSTIFMRTFLGWLEKPAHRFLPPTATCVPQRRSHILLISMPPTTWHDPWHVSRCPVKELDPGARPARLLRLRQEDSQVQDVCGLQSVQSQPKQVTENLSRKQRKRGAWGYSSVVGGFLRMPQPEMPSSPQHHLNRNEETAIRVVLAREKRLIMSRDRGPQRTGMMESWAWECRVGVNSGDRRSLWS